MKTVLRASMIAAVAALLPATAFAQNPPSPSEITFALLSFVMAMCGVIVMCVLFGLLSGKFMAVCGDLFMGAGTSLFAGTGSKMIQAAAMAASGGAASAAKAGAAAGATASGLTTKAGEAVGASAGGTAKAAAVTSYVASRAAGVAGAITGAASGAMKNLAGVNPKLMGGGGSGGGGGQKGKEAVAGKDRPAAPGRGGAPAPAPAPSVPPAVPPASGGGSAPMIDLSAVSARSRKAIDEGGWGDRWK